jgi:hypothetical protein
MKLIKILLLIIVVLNFIPIDALVVDHSHAEADHHCVLVCHSGCHVAVIPVSETAAIPFQSNLAYSSVAFSYDSPVIPNPKRPPIYLS